MNIQNTHGHWSFTHWLSNFWPQKCKNHVWSIIVAAKKTSGNKLKRMFDFGIHSIYQNGVSASVYIIVLYFFFLQTSFFRLNFFFVSLTLRSIWIHSFASLPIMFRGHQAPPFLSTRILNNSSLCDSFIVYAQQKNYFQGTYPKLLSGDIS